MNQPTVEIPEVRNMSAAERAAAQESVRITKEHLLRWLSASGRDYLVLKSAELVEALPFPDGTEALQQILSAYAALRATKPSGRFEIQVTPKGKVEIPIMKGETLEIEELDRAIRYLSGVAAKLDPSWRLENAPL